MNLKQLWSIIRSRRTNFSWANASWTYYPDGDPIGKFLMEKDELKPCPFCGGEAGVLIFDDVPQDDVNFGGSCISCRQCGACSPVHFDRKENLYSSWNDRVNQQETKT